MKICILGAGAVGTSFAMHLALAGHDVTLVARGARLDKLTRDGGVIATSPPTTPTPAHVTVATAVDPTCAWDLVLVTVLAHQLDAALLGVLKSCPDSATVMFMFTTFAPLDEYRNAVGASRCVFGFPSSSVARFLNPVPPTPTWLSSHTWRSTGRGLATAAQQALEMLDAFASVGAERFDFTFTDVTGERLVSTPVS